MSSYLFIGLSNFLNAPNSKREQLNRCCMTFDSNENNAEKPASFQFIFLKKQYENLLKLIYLKKNGIYLSEQFGGLKAMMDPIPYQ